MKENLEFTIFTTTQCGSSSSVSGSNYKFSTEINMSKIFQTQKTGSHLDCYLLKNDRLFFQNETNCKQFTLHNFQTFYEKYDIQNGMEICIPDKMQRNRKRFIQISYWMCFRIWEKLQLKIIPFRMNSSTATLNRNEFNDSILNGLSLENLTRIQNNHEPNSFRALYYHNICI